MAEEGSPSSPPKGLVAGLTIGSQVHPGDSDSIASPALSITSASPVKNPITSRITSPVPAGAPDVKVRKVKP